RRRPPTSRRSRATSSPCCRRASASSSPSDPMTTWVALLRGVNVGGITIRNADLKDVFAELGFDAVRTVLASGNVVFEAGDAASARPKLKSAIEKALGDRFGYDAWIVL